MLPDARKAELREAILAQADGDQGATKRFTAAQDAAAIARHPRRGKEQDAMTVENDTLSAKQERFCQEYLTDLNGRQAAIRAGYSAKTAEVQASRLLTNAKVRARIEALKAERKERVDLDNDYVLRRLQTVVERCMQEAAVTRGGKPVMVTTPAGEVAAAFAFDANGATRALELLGKHIGLFEKDNKQKGIADLTTAELQRMLDERETPEVKAERLRQLEAEIDELMFGAFEKPAGGEENKGATGGRMEDEG